MVARNFKNLVFEGGGVKGIAYGGALKVLQEMGILENIERAGGTSAGALNATLLALGYSVLDISDIIAQTDFSKFADGGSLFSKIPRLWRKYGINRGDVFSKFLKERIKAKTGNPELTFKQLSELIAKGNSGCRFLYIISTDLAEQRPIIFSHEKDHNPDTPIWQAVRMSMSIPLYFQAVNFRNSVMVDGGVSYNYAVNIFDHKKYLSRTENGDTGFYKDVDGRVFNYETLGFRLDSQQVIKYSHLDWSIPPQKIGNFKEYIAALLNFMMEMANKAHLVPEDWNRTIFIDTLDVGTTDFSIKKEKIDALIKSGKECTLKYFDWRDKENHWNNYPV